MQYLDNDMDELFRKAAENFKLKDGKDWDKVAASLHEPALTTLENLQGARKYPMLIIFSLLTLTSVITFLVTQEKSVTAIHSGVLQNKHQAAPSINVLEHIAQELSAPNNNISKQSRLNIALRLKKSNGINQDSPHSVTTGIIITPERRISNNYVLDQAQNIEKQSNKIMESELADTLFKQSPMMLDKMEAQNDSAENSNAATSGIPIQSSKRKRGIYAGLFAGSQLNQVEGQGFNKMGLSVGLMAGYAINKKLSIEGGLFYSQKHYYSDGKYFNMKKGAMPAGMKVINLEGTTDILEIPVKLKYDLIQKRKGALYITAGLSSYILDKEKNQYFILINGVEQDMNVNYKQRKTYLAGAVNFSAGYNINIQEKSSIRIEPYIQIPFKGTGVGSLRVMTTGIHIGVTRDFHR
jgi:Outer membrane protein beta-barrel domain